MKTMLLAAALSGALSLYVTSTFAGEDTTDRYGQGGTGVPYYGTNCGLTKFPGPRGNREDRRPCGRSGLAYNENGELIPAQAEADKKPAPVKPEQPKK